MCLVRSVALAVLGAAAVSVAAARGGESGPTADEIARLVKQLDADQFSERQAASEKLAAAGKAAIPALIKAAEGESLEATVRSVEILKKFLQSPDEATQKAAREALESITKSGRASAAQRAEEALRPKPDPNVQPAPNAGQIMILGGPGGGAIQVQGAIQVAAAGGNAKRVSVKSTNGVKEIEVEENDKKIRIDDDPQQGIKVEITTKKDGKETTKKFEAKTAEELKKKHPEAHKVYEEYAQKQGGLGNVQIQIGVAPGQGQMIPLQVPAQAQPAVPRTAQLGSLEASMKIIGRHVERLSKDRPWKDAPPEAKEKLKKQIAELKQQLAELEKQMQAE